MKITNVFSYKAKKVLSLLLLLI